MSERFNCKYRMESARLRGWDYRNPGFYFVTINTGNREKIFGEIDAENTLNDIGLIAKQCWMKIPEHFPHVEIDEFIVMPDHVHGIIVVKEYDLHHRKDADFPCRDAACCVSTGVPACIPMGVPTGMCTNDDSHINKPASGSLSAIIRSYKSAVTKVCHERGHVRFAWQARFYDRVIRDEEELYYTRKYIQDNPVNYNKARF